MLEIPRDFPFKEVVSGRQETDTIFPGEVGVAPALTGCRAYVVQYPPLVAIGHFFMTICLVGLKQLEP